MNAENELTIKKLIYSLLFLALGIILLTNTSDIVNIASTITGAVLVVIGIIKCIIYIYMKGKLQDYSINKLVIGLAVLCLGIVLILYSSALSFIVRIFIGLWCILSGINKIILAISVRTIDNTGYKVSLSTSFVMIIAGVLIISGVFDQLIGAFIIVYSVMEIINYIYYKSGNKKYDIPKKTKNKKQKTKKIKSKKVVDAIVEE